MLLLLEADSLLDRLRGEWGGKCLQRQPHLHCITASQLWRRATELFNCFGALNQRSSDQLSAVQPASRSDGEEDREDVQ